MIEKLWNQAHILHQEGEDIPNVPIIGQIDNDNTIIISQEGRHICVDRPSIPELCKLLKMLSKLKAEQR